MTHADILKSLEELAPPALQESYDNAGLLVGNANDNCTGVLICLDSIEAVLYEAIAKNCNLIVAHHPIIFSGLKSLTGRTYIERVIINAIKNDISIYAMHTNLDNVAEGVNSKICERLNLSVRTILRPKSGILKKLITFVPEKDLAQLEHALFAAGAGNLGNYSACSFKAKGTGSFMGNAISNPSTGEKGKREFVEEYKVEFHFQSAAQKKIVQALHDAHPYEEVAYDIISLENTYNHIGSGMVGELAEAMAVDDFLQHVKSSMNAKMIRHTTRVARSIKRVAVCGGSGSFLLKDAIRAKADVFITADFKYHEFFDADGKIMILDIGHYETEQFTQDLIYEYLSKKFNTFALHCSEVNTNPINYT